MSQDNWKKEVIEAIQLLMPEMHIKKLIITDIEKDDENYSRELVGENTSLQICFSTSTMSAIFFVFELEPLSIWQFQVSYREQNISISGWCSHEKNEPIIKKLHP